MLMLIAAAVCAFPAFATPLSVTTQETAINAPADPPLAAMKAPLPPIDALMNRVEEQLQASDKVRRDYLYRSTSLFQEFDSKGRLKKSTTEVRDDYTIDGVQVSRLLQKDGKPLTPEETRKEDERIKRDVEKGKERIAQGSHTGEKDEVSLARILQLGTISNERRVLRDSRPTLLLDYHGNVDAKSHTAAEAIFKELVGTIAVDEETGGVVHTEGTFMNTYKVADGLIASVSKGTSFSMDQMCVNGEVWLPRHLEGHGSARLLLLVHMNGRLSVDFSGYRKFHTSAVILPSDSVAEPAPEEPASNNTAPPK